MLSQAEVAEVATAFAGSVRVREVMMASGVQGEPAIWFGNSV